MGFKVLVPVWTITIPQSTLSRLDKRTYLVNQQEAEINFPSAEAWLTLFGRLTQILVYVCSKRWH